MPWEEQLEESPPSARKPETVNPYEDWDTKTILPIRDPVTLWYPVYIQIQKRNGTFSEAAKELNDALRANIKHENPDLAAPISTFRILQRILDPDRGEESKDYLKRMFIYRNAVAGLETPYDPVIRTVNETEYSDIVDRVLTVGPAIPGSAGKTIDVGRVGNLALPVPEVGVFPAPVFTAVIDDEIGFLNARFRHSRLATRIMRFWSMGLERMNRYAQKPGTSVPFGQVLEKSEIDTRLQQLANGRSEAAVYSEFDEGMMTTGAKALQPGAFRDPNRRRPRQLVESHGTAVLDLAGGADPGPGTGTFDNGKRLLAVELPQLATAETHGGRLDTYILQAVFQVLDWADTIDLVQDDPSKSTPRPVVVNISYGIHAGAKDGSGLLESELRRIAEARTNFGVPTRFVLTAGNNYRSRGRAFFEITPESPEEIDWRIQPDDGSSTFLEVHARDVAGTSMALEVPGEAQLTIPLDAATSTIWDLKRPTLTNADGGTEAHGKVYLRRDGDHSRVIIVLAPTRPNSLPNLAVVPSGRYLLSFSQDQSNASAPTKISVETQRDDTPFGYRTGARQSYLDRADANGLDPDTGQLDMPDDASALTREGTLSAFATAGSELVYIVGGVMSPAVSDELKAALYVSSGPTIGKDTPDLSTVSEDGRAHFGRMATGLYSGSSAIFSGTSMAAPLVTRALVHLTGRVEGPSKGQLIAKMLRGGATLPAADPQIGEGVLGENRANSRRMLGL